MWFIHILGYYAGVEKNDTKYIYCQVKEASHRIYVLYILHTKELFLHTYMHMYIEMHRNNT